MSTCTGPDEAETTISQQRSLVNSKQVWLGPSLRYQALSSLRRNSCGNMAVAHGHLHDKPLQISKYPKLRAQLRGTEGSVDHGTSQGDGFLKVAPSTTFTRPVIVIPKITPPVDMQ